MTGRVLTKSRNCGRYYNSTKPLALHRRFAGLTGPDPNGVVDGADEYFTVADFTRLGRLDDRVDGRLDPGIGQDNFELNFRQKIHRVLAAPINLGVPLLPAKAFDLA